MKSRPVRISLLLCALLSTFVLISIVGTRGFTRTGSPTMALNADQSRAIDQFMARRGQLGRRLGAIKTAAPALADAFNFRAASGFNLNAMFAPNISVMKSAALAMGGDVNNNGFVNPGDTLTYTVLVSNAAGAMDATSVTFTDVLNGDLTLIGMASVSPIALNDSYTATGNVAISVPAGSGVLANDYLGQNPAATVTAFDASSTQGGTVAVTANGSFTYTPPGNFTGTDTFTYTLSNSTGSSIATVTITVSDRILFVSSSGSGTNCRPATPCTLATADGVATIGSGRDLVFVTSGTYSSAAISLNPAQTIAGQAISITQALIDASITLAPNSQTLSFAASTAPVLNNSANIITLSSNNLVENLSINPSGGSGILGNNITTGTDTVRDLTIAASSSANGVSLTGTNTGGTFNFSNIGITAA